MFVVATWALAPFPVIILSKVIAYPLISFVIAFLFISHNFGGPEKAVGGNMATY